MFDLFITTNRTSNLFIRLNLVCNFMDTKSIWTKKSTTQIFTPTRI
jgi:hypothetical protein